MKTPFGRQWLGVALALASACGCSESDSVGGAGSAEEHGRARHIVLITLDTVRADHLGCYGYARDTTPRLDALAAASTRYTRARAAAPWTLPSHASIFTGLYPLEHGAHTYELPELPEAERYNQVLALKSGQISALPDTQHTLAEALRSVGYETGAVVANAAYLSPKMGLAQGFEHYDCDQDHAPAVNARALAWLDQVGDKPFFLFVNYMDAHLPFNATPQPELFPAGVSPDSLQLFEQLYVRILRSDEPAVPAELATLVDQYDLALRNLDDGLGALIDALKQRGLWDDALVVVTSDHGEFLGEKRLLGHNKDVYEGALMVPLIVKLPGQTVGRLDDEPISHVHLARLILEHAARGQKAAAKLAAPKPRERILAENYYSRLRDLEPPWGARFDRVRRVLYVGDLKFIHSSDGAHELYDLAADPHEEHNLLEDEDSLATWQARLGGLLSELERSGERTGLDLDDTDLDNLRELGYLGDE